MRVSRFRRFLVVIAAFGALAIPSARAQVFAVSAGNTAPNSFLCAVTTANTVRCWGDNGYGQLGNNGTTPNPSLEGVDVVTSSTDATPLSGVVSVVAGNFHACALLETGTVKCWGYNGAGQLGNGQTANAVVAPVDVRTDAATALPLTGVVGLAAGTNYTCATLSSGGVRCWGQNTYGQLGDGTTTTRMAPVAVVDVGGGGELTGVADVSTFYEHTCARTAAGQVRCWGAGSNGRMGDGETRSTSAVTAPVVVRTSDSDASPLSGVEVLSVGYGHACARLTSGGVVCWGFNSLGPLGTGDTATRTAPAAVVGVGGSGVLDNAVEVTAGFNYSCASRTDGSAVCWGTDTAGTLGNGGARTSSEFSTSPVNVVTPSPGAAAEAPAAHGAVATGFSSLRAGAFHACALYNGAPYCWGYNHKGQTGVGSNTTQFYTAPVAVQGTSVLPVELVSFTAAADGATARLAWTTASETNNASFTVEQRTAAGWVAATSVVAGRGTTSERTDYAVAVDNLAPGRHAFRLRQTDLDGTSSLSPVVEVEIGGVSGVSFVRRGNGSSSPSVRVSGERGVRVEVYDVLGRRVQSVEAPAGAAEVSLAALSAGTYIVRATSGSAAATTTVVVR